ncbi:cysteine dioxygenase family protein [Bacillus cereus group sp. N6]|uniref:cysteine dioxygenase n=1 Tax=Bacillus cereus group sp. N6 TaxID=2794583 RepID=UPI0018F5CEC7|nr:cysteine dioxygenase family protein [Bacillus cereus group sp. N6]MBJ8113117.1 cysteine dioxygenase family protein [Bacillus cereus group sp. N6]
MDFIEVIQRSLDSLQSYSQQELIQMVQTFDLSPENVMPYVTVPRQLEYGRNIIYHTKKIEVMVLHFPSLAKTPIHDHGISTGCIYVVQGKLHNILYTFKSEESNPTYNQVQQLKQGDLFTVDNGTIHMMQNPTPLSTITFHVYSPPLEGVKIHLA